MGREVFVGGANGLESGRVTSRGLGHELGQCLEQLARGVVFEGVQEAVAPGAGLRAVAEEFGGEGLEVLTGVVEVEGADGAELETIFKDVPQPHGPVHDHINLLRLCQAHPARLVLDPAAERDRIGGGRRGHDMFREQGATARAHGHLVPQPIDDRRLDLVPLHPFLTLGAALPAPVLAAMPCHPAVHHNDEGIVRSRPVCTRGGQRLGLRLAAQRHHARADRIVANATAPFGRQGGRLLEGAGRGRGTAELPLEGGREALVGREPPSPADWDDPLPLRDTIAFDHPQPDRPEGTDQVQVDPPTPGQFPDLGQLRLLGRDLILQTALQTQAELLPQLRRQVVFDGHQLGPRFVLFWLHAGISLLTR